MVYFVNQAWSTLGAVSQRKSVYSLYFYASRRRKILRRRWRKIACHAIFTLAFSVKMLLDRNCLVQSTKKISFLN